ncbi:MAG: zf-HC2 domain-containing protein [Deltaproteobacteria bacterium]|nr:zf-HC2 domain-containing protein [Deltaproteobacteria bacterium]MBV8451171.1 zf-HC2 domain-containing protein [Deltaproteobacteria bacterium]
MNCDEYIDQFLSADADGQLSAPERRLAEEHLRGCHQCCLRLGEELTLKASIRRHMGITKAPADVRLRLRAALGEAAEPSTRRDHASASAVMSFREEATRQSVFSSIRGRAAAPRHSSNETAGRAVSARRWLAIQFKRAHYLAPVGFVIIVLAASTITFRAIFMSMSGRAAPDYEKSVPVFDFAIGRFNQLSQEFSPNVPAEAFRRDDSAYFAWVEESDPLRHVSAELPDISASYEKMQMPPEFCDFAMAGYELVGGRIDRMPDGDPVTYTLYRNQVSSILSIGLKQRFSVPHDGYWFDTHALYSYRGYSICLTIYPNGHFASIIVARMPMVELLRDIATSDGAFRDG